MTPTDTETLIRQLISGDPHAAAAILCGPRTARSGSAGRRSPDQLRRPGSAEPGGPAGRHHPGTPTGRHRRRPPGRRPGPGRRPRPGAPRRLPGQPSPPGSPPEPHSATDPHPTHRQGETMNRKLTAVLLHRRCRVDQRRVHRARHGLQLPRRPQGTGRGDPGRVPRLAERRDVLVRRTGPLGGTVRAHRHRSRSALHHRAMRVAVPVGIAAAVVQVIGLSRWPLLVPGFAADAASADPGGRGRGTHSFVTGPPHPGQPDR